MAPNTHSKIIRSSLVMLLSLSFGLLLGAILLKGMGASPLKAYKAMVLGGFGSRDGLAESLVKAIPLILVASGLCVAYRTKYWNIGAEGQICAGAIACTWLALQLPALPSWLGLPLLFLAGALGGLFYAAIAGVLRAYRGVNEIITTIMLNYVALHGVSYLVKGPLRDPLGYLPESAEIPLWAHLPTLGGTRLHGGLFLAILATCAMAFLLRRTTAGFAMDAVGANPRAATYGGISTKGVLLTASLISGAMAGLAGSVEVMGIHFRLREMISSGYGFIAIMVALLGKSRPLAALAAGVLLASFQVGADHMERELHLPSSIILVIEGIVVLCVLVGDRLQEKRWTS